MLSNNQQSSWNLYLSFAVFSYYLWVLSSINFTHIFLTFGSEACLPPDIVFCIAVSALDNVSTDSGQTSGKPLALLLQLLLVLARSFTDVQENLHSFHQREKKSV